MRRLPVAADGRYVRRVPKETLVGRTIAGYAIRSEVGEGGTSAVFRAEHPTHGVVAVKVLREKLRQDKTAVARFVREARYGERVRHPNVVQTLEVGEATPGMHFLAIEWATGELLERYAKQHGPLPPDEVTAIVSGPEVEWTMVPKATMQYAAFMHAVGSIKPMPARWQDMFFPEIAELGGS